MKRKTFLTAIMLVLFFASFAKAQLQADGAAGLVITPTRVELEGKQRSASITIANNGTKRGSYKIQLINKHMTEDGQILDISTDIKDGMFADKLLRISPRRVDIEPGQNQNIRILVRKPKDLKEGEYRTHLSVMIMPDAQESSPSNESDNSDKLTITVKANYGVTIPVIVKNGNLSASGEMGEIKYHPANSAKKENAKLIFNISRQGNKSLYGDIKVVYINLSGKESLIKFMGGMAIYTPNELRKFEIPLDSAESAQIGKGILRVIYQAKENDGGKIIAQHDLKL